MSFAVNDQESLWMSTLSKLDGSAPIRGGVPIAFPQFADSGPLKLHGFARDSIWSVSCQTTSSVTLTLSEDEQTLSLWPHNFTLTYTVTLGPASLRLNLKCKNTGLTPLTFSTCLHTYFRFSSTSEIYLTGLSGCSYVDKCGQRVLKTQDTPTLNMKDEAAKSGEESLIPGFVDRIYKNTPNSYTFTRGSDVLYEVRHSPSFKDTVVYNPWLGDKRGPAGPDYDDDGYTLNICLEVRTFPES